MTEPSTVITVTGLFMLRIGLPVLGLFGLGILIERWQGKQRAKARHDYGPTGGSDLSLPDLDGEES